MFPNLLDMGEESPPILPGETVKAEETHHPLKGSGEAGRLIRHDAPVGQAEFQWNRPVAFHRPFLIEGMKDPTCLIVASQDNRRRFGRISPESIEPVRMIEQSDVVALLVKMISRCETGESGTEDEDCAGGMSGHENREQNQMRKAIITRWVVVRLMRDPKT